MHLSLRLGNVAIKPQNQLFLETPRLIASFNRERTPSLKHGLCCTREREKESADKARVSLRPRSQLGDREGGERKGLVKDTWRDGASHWGPIVLDGRERPGINLLFHSSFCRCFQRPSVQNRVMDFPRVLQRRRRRRCRQRQQQQQAQHQPMSRPSAASRPPLRTASTSTLPVYRTPNSPWRPSS